MLLKKMFRCIALLQHSTLKENSTIFQTICEIGPVLRDIATDIIREYWLQCNPWGQLCPDSERSLKMPILAQSQIKFNHYAKYPSAWGCKHFLMTRSF